MRATSLALGLLLTFASVAEAGRNSSGTYSLPAGNPVVSGTTITSTWANNTLNDVSTELTSSLDRSGRGAMLAPLQCTSGTAAAPALTFSTDTDSGLYRVSANSVGLSCGGAQVQSWSTTGTAITGTASVSGASTLTGALTCGSSATVAADLTVDTSTLKVDSTNNRVGIGDATPDVPLDVEAASAANNLVDLQNTSSDGFTAIDFYSSTSSKVMEIGYGNPSSAAFAGSPFINIYGGGVLRIAGEGTSRVTINSSTGYIGMVGATNPASNTAVVDTLTPKNIPKAWARVTSTGGGATTATVGDGFNVSGASVTGSGLVLTLHLAAAMASTTYSVIATPASWAAVCWTTITSTTTLGVLCSETSSLGSGYDFQAGAARSVNILVFGEM